MEYREFEHQLTSKLNNQTYLVDTESLIKGIHGEKDEKRRPVVFLFLFAAIGLIGFGSWIYLTRSVSVVKSNLNKTKAIAQLDEAISGGAIPKKDIPVTSLKINEPTIYQSNNHVNNKKLDSQISSNSTLKSKGFTNQSASDNKASNLNSSFSQILAEDGGKVNNSIGTEESSNRHIASNIKSLHQQFQYFEINQRVIKTDKVICPSFKINKGLGLSFAIIPEIGAFYPIKRFSSNNQDNAVFQSREKNEKTLEGINSAIYGRAYFGKLRSFYGQVGVSYTTLTERMKLKYDYEKIDTSFGIISITVSQSGDTVTTIYGPIYQRKRITGEKTRHHSFGLWDIPVGIGYEYNLGRVNIGIEGGVNINMSLTPKGTIYQGDTTFVASNDAGNGFKKRLGASFYVGVSASTPISKNGDLYLACRMRYIPDAFTLDNSQISQAYHFTGLNLGYIHRF